MDLRSSLLDTLASDSQVRTRAESHLNVMQTQPGYPSALIDVLTKKSETSVGFASNNSVIDPVQHIASLLLKKLIKNAWEPTTAKMASTSNAVTPISSEEKVYIKQQLVQCLDAGSIKESKVLTGLCMVVAAITKYDWPEHWPELFPTLMRMIASANIHQVQVGVKCILLMSDHFNSKHLIQLVPILFPHLKRIFEMKEHFSARIRLKTIAIVQSCLVMLGTMAQAGESDAQQVLEMSTEQWIHTFLAGLQEPVNSSADYALKIQIFKALSALVKEWPKQMNAILPELLPTIWHLLGNGLSVYEANVVLSHEMMGDEYDSDGQNLGFGMFIVHVFEFLRSIMQVSTKHSRKIMEPSLCDLVYVLIGYLQMTQEQMDVWEDDPNQYVADEDDESLEYSVRNAGAELFSDLEEVFGLKALQAISISVQKRLHEASSTWRMHEAAILAIGTVATPMLRMIKSRTTKRPPVALDLDVESFMTSLVQVILDTHPTTTESSPYLRARSLWCISRFAELVPLEKQGTIVQAAVLGIDASEKVPLRLYACRAIGTMSLSKKVQGALVPFAHEMLVKLLDLASQATFETLHLVLGTLQSVVALNESATERMLDRITELVWSLWLRHASDPLVTECTLGVLEVEIKFSSCHARLEPILLDSISSILREPDQWSAILDSCIELLELLLQHSTSPLPVQYLEKSLGPLLHLLIHTDDHSVLEAGASCLKYYVRLGASQLLHWSHTDGRCSIDCIMSVAARLLDPQMSESACLSVGGLVTQLIQQLATQLPPQTVSSMLGAVIARLEKAETPSLIQALCLVFARLIHSHGPLLLVDVLQELNALQFVMSTWLFAQPEFYGSYNLKVTVSALTKLLALRDPRLESLRVKGDKVEDEDGRADSTRRAGMRTRSGRVNPPERFAIVPFPSRLFAVLLRVLPLVEEEAEWESCDEDEEDDDDDDDEGDASEEEEEEEVKTSFLSDGMESGAFHDQDDDEEENFDDVDDFEAKSDPLNAIDLKDHLLNVFRSLQKESMIQSLAAMLNTDDLAILREYSQTS